MTDWKEHGLLGGSLPSHHLGGAWLVEWVRGDSVKLISADMTATQIMTVSRFNEYWRAFEKAKNES